jgi:hypothetical protein
MAFLKSTPLTSTGIPRLPEDTIQSCKTSQVVRGRLLGISLGPILGVEEGNVDIDGLYEG